MTPEQLNSISDPFLQQYKDEFVDIRRTIHKNPEIGLVTPETSALIAKKLREYGVDTVETGIGGYGVVGVIQGNQPSDIAIGLRADIDALALEETSQHDHVSLKKGIHHGCGHDGHAATLLAVAKLLSAKRDFPGKVVLIFQPGEEGWSGAKVMLDDGLFERFPVNEVYAYHNSSMIPPGKIAIKLRCDAGSGRCFYDHRYREGRTRFKTAFKPGSGSCGCTHHHCPAVYCFQKLIRRNRRCFLLFFTSGTSDCAKCVSGEMYDCWHGSNLLSRDSGSCRKKDDGDL